MSFTKFMDLLTLDRSFFASVALLRRDDPLEGVLPSANMLVESGFADAVSHLVNVSMVYSLGVGHEAERLRTTPAPKRAPTRYETVFGTFDLEPDWSLPAILEREAQWIDVQCWHGSEVESVAMWKIYGGSEPSVAIRSTVGRLGNALGPAAKECIHLGAVSYIDHDGDPCGVEHPLEPFLRKGLAYAYEREVRAIAYLPSQDIRSDRVGVGRYITTDLAELVTEIIVSPTAPEWFLDLITTIVAPKLQVPIARSRVNRKPWYAG